MSKLTIASYYGGKINMIDTLVPILETIPHKAYIEAFGGMGSILLNKKPVHKEVLNDLDSLIHNLYTIIRNHPRSLIDAINLTPYSRQEYKLIIDNLDLAITIGDPIDLARCAYALIHLSRSRSLTHGGFRSVGVKYQSNAARHFHTNHHLLHVAARLSSVVLENTDYQKLFQAWNGNDSLFYFDPPYPNNTRTSRGYRHEWNSTKQADMLSFLIQNSASKIVFSTYWSPEYTALEASGWLKIQKPTKVSNRIGGHIIQTEIIFLSPAAAPYYNPTTLFPTTL